MIPAADPLVGHTLAGQYTITGFIGEGGMATVYRGIPVDPAATDDDAVAIKILHPTLLSDATFVRRFRREAKAAARLVHPNTVQIVGYGIDGELVYIVMELLVGLDLNTVLHRERRLTEARAAQIVIEVCGALACAHGEGIVHRDLKPENVMVLAPGAGNPGPDRVKVLDFGIAKIIENLEEPADDADEDPSSSSRSVLTRAGTLIGTPEYMSPEQCQAQPVDARSDLYSCGVLLYQLITGRVPFEGEVPLQIVRRHIDEPPRPPSHFAPGIHAGLEATILRALAKDPAMRQPSAVALAAELRRWLPELAGARQLSVPPIPSPRVHISERPEIGDGPDSDRARTIAMTAAGSDQTRTRVRQEQAAPPSSDGAQTRGYVAQAPRGLRPAWERNPRAATESPDSGDEIDSARTVIAQSPPADRSPAAPTVPVRPAPEPARAPDRTLPEAGYPILPGPSVTTEHMPPAAGPGPDRAVGPEVRAKTAIIRRPDATPEPGNSSALTIVIFTAIGVIVVGVAAFLWLIPR